MTSHWWSDTGHVTRVDESCVKPPFVRDHSSVTQSNNPSRSTCERQIVRHENDGRSRLAIQCLEQLDDAHSCVTIEISRRLIREQNPRPVRECACDRDSLLLAARELSRKVVEAIAESDALQHVTRAFDRMILATQLERNLHVFDRGECRDQLKALKDEAHLLAAQAGARILVERCQLGAIEVHCPSRRRIKTREQSEQRCLAASRRADYGEKFALIDAKCHVSKHCETVIAALIFLSEIGCG